MSDPSPGVQGPRDREQGLAGPGSPDPGWSVDGPAGGAPIVLVHGSRLTRVSWRGVIGFLASEYRVIAVDLPGHGSRADETFTLPRAAGAIAAAIDREAGGRAVVVGHSLGGYAAMELAATAPERVRGLVVSGASQEPRGRWSPAFRALAWFLESRYVGALDWANDRFYPARYPPEIAGPIVAARYWATGGSNGLRSILAAEFRPRLAAYPGPTLILNGELDVIIRMGERAFVRAAQHGRRRIIPRATHLSNLDRPDLFAAAVASFVRSLEP